MQKRAIGILALAALIALVACGGGGQTSPSSPEITQFYSEDEYIPTGESTTLMFAVTGTSPIHLSIDHDVGPVSGGSEDVSPSETTTYTLTATSDFGTDTETTTVNVGSAPSLSSVAASPATITEGESSTLSWSITGTTPITLTIDQGVGDVTGQSSEVVSPTSTTVYTITAESEFGSDSASVAVTVEAAVTTLAPTASTCDGVAVSSSCLVTISLANTEDEYEGLEFDFTSAAFDLTDASTSIETSGCVVDAGAVTVIVACGAAFGAGDVASLSVQRSSSSASVFETSNAYVAPDDETKISVGGGTLAVAAAN